jgi:hypothetical protein
MSSRKVNSLAQSLSEYVLLIGIVSIAFISMQTYMKRGIHSVIKVAADELGSQQYLRDIDLQKGTQTSSLTETVAQSTERSESFVGGRQRTTTEKDSATSSSATYIYKRKR